jgi:hypothetical protein
MLQVGRHWWWLSFWATYITQHAMLVGITLPLLAVYTSGAPWAALDTVAALTCVAGACVWLWSWIFCPFVDV